MRRTARLFHVLAGAGVGLTLAGQAAAVGLVSRGEAPGIVRERAVLAFDQKLGTQTLTLELTLEGQADDSLLLVVQTPARPSFSGATTQALDAVGALVREAEKGKVSGDSVPLPAPAEAPKLVQLLPTKDSAAILAWATQEKLQLPSGFRGWVGSLGADAYVSFVRLTPKHGKLTTRVAFKTTAAFYPYSSPSLSKVDLDLVLLSETPIGWFRGTPDKKRGPKNTLSVNHTVDGTTANARFDEATRKVLGLESDLSALWVGRYTTREVERSLAPNAWFDASGIGDTKSGSPLAGRPFGAASAKPAPSTPERSKPTLSTGAAGEQSPKVRGRRKGKKWPTSARVGFLFFVVLIVGGVMWFLKRRESA